MEELFQSTLLLIAMNLLHSVMLQNFYQATRVLSNNRISPHYLTLCSRNIPTSFLRKISPVF